MKNATMNYKKMNKYRVLVGAIVTVFFIAACGSPADSKEESHDGDNHSSTERATKAGVQSSSIQLKDDALDAVYQQYITLNQALVNSNMKEAKFSANTLELGANELTNGSKVAINAAKISEANTIKDQRAAFSDLSNALIVLVKESGVASGKIYVDYCPMALNNTGGFWLSTEEGIKNPYFGDSMLTCGETKETII